MDENNFNHMDEINNIKENNFDKAEYFVNRELSWLEFNERVLQEARDRNNPLFERMKFLSIVCSNLDEFFMIRVASLKDMVIANFSKPDAAGLTPKQQLKRISTQTHEMVDTVYSTLNRGLIPLLRKNGVELLDLDELEENQLTFLREYFNDVVYPVLTPMAVDSSRPFPLILNKSLNIGVLVKNNEKGEDIFATVQVPAVLPRTVEIPPVDGEGKRAFVLLEDVIIMFIESLFTGRKIECAYPYRITRNADLSIEEEEAEDLLVEIEKSLKMRNWGAAIRLEVDSDMDERLVNILKEALQIHKGDIYYISGPIDLTFLMKMWSLSGYEEFKFDDYEPVLPDKFVDCEDYFELIKSKDILLHHPYESFEPTVEFIRQASKDPDVLAIKQTLYRVSGNSPIVSALEEAAELGKQVMVLVEVKARFDEFNNIQWSKRLERAGCHVIYGLVGLKTHSKITLVVRREDNGIKRYLHLGTGNYNDMTARFYTDLGLFTCNEAFGADASAFFNMLSGYSEAPHFKYLVTAPLGLRSKYLELIEHETKNAMQGKKAVIIAKMNSLVDTEIIKALYKASIAGVKIELIVRGICCLRPGIPGLSDNITIRSIVARFLEHSRIFYFYNGGDEKIFLSSADWMPRNLDRRVEILFPIEDAECKEKIKDILDITLSDTVKARLMQTDGTYVNIDRRGKRYLESQITFSELANDIGKNYNREHVDLLGEEGAQ